MEEFERLMEAFDAITDMEQLAPFRENLTAYGQLGEGLNAKMTQLEQLNAELSQKVTDVSAHNYDLMVAAANASTEVNDAENADEEAVTDEVADVDDLLEERK